MKFNHVLRSYTVENGQRFTVPSRYIIKKFLYVGAYGTVVSSYDLLRGEHVAIKKCSKILDIKKEDNLLSLQRMFRELEVLLYTKTNPNSNIVDLHSVYVIDTDIYIVFELLDCDLRDFLRSRYILENESTLKNKILLYEILKGLRYLHLNRILHLDLKPRNILLSLDKDCCVDKVKICDFGLSRQYIREQKNNEIVVTRWYRCLELLLEHNYVSEKIDSWSFGCLIPEISFNKGPLFRGNNTLHQINKIIDVLGKPKKDELKGSESAKNYVQNIPTPTQPKIQDFEEAFDLSEENKTNNDYNLIMDLLQKCLHFNPDKRFTIDDALKHEFFKEVYNENDFGYGINEFVSKFNNKWEKKELIDKTKELIKNFNEKNVISID